VDNYNDETPQDEFKELAEWITERTDAWREHRQQNYDPKWAEYYNIWRGIWTGDSKTRESERAKLITPATQQAIESHVSEVEEAIFGRGMFFDCEPDTVEQDPNGQMAVEMIKNNLTQDFKRDKIRKAVGDCLLNAAIFGTGIGELVVNETQYRVPATEPLGPGMMAVGSREKQRFSVKLKPIQPNNFLIEPNAKCVDEALGCAVEEFVSLHSIVKGMEDGIYRDVDIGTDERDDRLSPTFEDTERSPDRVKVLRYYGLVPKRLLEVVEGDVVELFEEEETSNEVVDDYRELVEAIVIIVNDGTVIKAEASPYMMQDRPILSFQDDIIPNSFWGRGIAEKAYNSQKGLDAEVRSRIDNLALTSVPMVAMDASRLPRGAKFKIQPGGSVLTNGNPAEIIKEFKFGNLDQNSYQQSREFERMLLQATGTTDAGAVSSAVGGETNNGALSMALGLLIKRNKRTLVNFQENFLIPLVEKAAWRYMQYDPERYPAKNFKFVPVASMGIMAREYEQQQFAFLLQTMGPESPFYPLILNSIVDNSSVHNREQLQAEIVQRSQPSPEQQQLQQLQQQIAIATAQADLAKKQAEATKLQAEAQQVQLETEFLPQKMQAEVIAATTNNLDEDPTDKAFKQRLELTDRLLKEREIKAKERMVDVQMEGSKAQIAAKTNSEEAKGKLKEIEEVMARVMADRDTPGELAYDEDGKVAGLMKNGKLVKRVKRGADKKPTHIEPVKDE
jgi:hypothetical protein